MAILKEEGFALPASNSQNLVDFTVEPFSFDLNDIIQSGSHELAEGSQGDFGPLRKKAE